LRVALRAPRASDAGGGAGAIDPTAGGMSSQAPRDRAHNRPTISDFGGGRYLTIPTEAHLTQLLSTRCPLNRGQYKLRRLHRPLIRGILGEGKVGSGAVVIREIARQDATQVALAQDDDVVEAVAPDRSDKAFGEGILPRAPRSREDFSDLHPFTRWRNTSP
jgi:hypothetical protein